MDCANETAILKQELADKAGVISLEFDLLNAKMIVTYDSAEILPQTILNFINKTGMNAVPWELRTKQESGSLWQHHGRFIMAGVSGALLIFGFVVHWIQHSSLLDAFAAGARGNTHIFPVPSILLYVGSILFGAWFVIPKAIQSAKRLRPDMNLLMIVAVVGAIAINEWFEAATVSFLFALALLLEHWSVGRARRAISALMELSPLTARYIRPEDGGIVEKSVEEVPVGVTILVRPGEKIPLDGEVVKGISTVNQAPITGESMPVAKEMGNAVFAGTINEDGALEIKVTKLSKDTTLAKIIHMVEEAQSRRAHSEQWVEKFARTYTPIMMILAMAVVIVPPLLFSANWSEWLYRGLVILVIACPCALVISTPISIVSGLTAAARNGVLIKGGMYLEEASRLCVLCLDKTGTLTYGHPEVQKIVPFNDHTSEELLEIAAALEANSEHPLARAILRKAEEEGIAPISADDFQAINGKGAEARIQGQLFWIGSHRLMHEKGQETQEVHNKAEDLEDAGHSVIAVGNSQHVCGLISVADGIRENAQKTLQSIKQAGIRKVVMLTGDNIGSAAAVAKATGVDEFQAELLPEDKVEAVESFVTQFHHVAMVGDGVNDAPAMAVASLGVAMGAMGTDVAIETADITLMSDDLSKLPWLIEHSRKTLRTIKQNITFALGLKLAFIILALLNIATLWMAIVADTGASLLVIFNGLKLLGIKKRRFF
ncbi:MAG: cadmium-translocating P-type ATPase [Planctomycetota bacterium]|nr:MAG: cadmium-translocating P-type ATPase [Planctomycetota bacterium]